MSLQHVDAVIAFAVVMLGASLLIMVITQGISTFLNLRGKNLFRSLSDLLGTLYPDETDSANQKLDKAKNLLAELKGLAEALVMLPRAMIQALGGVDTDTRAEKISRRILEHPLLSDSSFGTGALSDQRAGYRLPLSLVMAGVVGVVWAWRSGSLGLEGWVTVVASFILTRWVSRDWELASAIRMEELVDMLGRNGAPSETSQAMARIARSLREPRLAELRSLSDMHKGELEAVAEQLIEALPAVTDTVEELVRGLGTAELESRLQQLQSLAGADARVLAGKLEQLARARGKVIDTLSNAEALLKDFPKAAETKTAELQTLFNAAMDRASQRFVVYSRLVTVAVSFVFAFVVHLDALALFNRLSSDSELRAKLIAGSDSMMREAGQIISAGRAASSSAAADSPSAAGANTVDAKATETEACLEKHDLGTHVPELYVAAMLCPETLEWVTIDRQKVGPLLSKEEAVDFLKAKFKASDGQIQSYRENLNTLLQKSDVDRLFDQAASINAQLLQGGIELWPDPYPGLWPRRGELPGLLVAGVLLSLGAPFWFNALKTLANMRPLVATREEKERQERQTRR